MMMIFVDSTALYIDLIFLCTAERFIFANTCKNAAPQLINFIIH